MTYSITITGPTSIDAVGFRARRAGLEVRDCLLILEPGNQARLGLLAKRETAQTVVEGYVREETGVLDLDRCRISTGGKPHYCYPNGAKGWGFHGGVGGREADGSRQEEVIAHGGGRFPANLILVHGPTCHCEGTKKVKNPSGSVTGNEPSAVTKNAYGKFQGRTSFSSFGDEDGTEEVANWICEQGCPVRILDGQSGTLKMQNEGGASRFFKQVQEEGELDSYLETLIRGSL